MRLLALLPVAALVACTPASDDPAEGGFFNGIAGLAGGGYEARVTEREQGVATAQGQQAALSAELASLQGQHAALKDQIIAQRAALRAEGVRLTPETETRIQAALTSSPSGSNPAALQQAIADARRLSEQLAGLAG